MNKFEQLKAQILAELSAAREIASKAHEAGQVNLTTAERTKVEEHMAKARHLKVQIDQEKSDHQLRGALDELGADLGLMGPEGARTGAKANPVHAKVRASGGAGDWAKAVMDDHVRRGSKSLLAGGTVPVTVPLDAEPVRAGEPVLSIRQLISAVPDSAGVWSYLRQTVRTNNASTVGEGRKKPTSEYTFGRVENRSRVIAHLSEPIPRQLLDDATALRSVLETEMRLGWEIELEDQVINGAGSTAGVLDDMVGIAATSGIQTQAWDEEGDHLTTARKAITKLENSSVAPNGWLMNPDTWERFELTADANERYLLGNAPVDRAARRLWGVPVVLSTVVLDDVAYLADFANGTKLRIRQEARLDWTENRYDPNKFGSGQGGSEFEANQITFRLEGRAGFDVSRPFAIVEVDLEEPPPEP